MGRDYRHRANKPEKFDDGYEMFKEKKLDLYDRTKGRKQNKIDLNHFQVDVDDEIIEMNWEEGVA